MPENAKQFVIQEHSTPEGMHWDFMLEAENILWTWRLDTPPAEIGNDSINATRIFDHPIRFLTYQGPVQNETGQVQISDKGIYITYERNKRVIVFDLQGAILSGRFQLSLREEQNWIFQRLEG